MRTKKLLVFAALVAAAVLLTLDSRSDVRLLEIRDGDVELVPLDGAAGPESVVFRDGGEGPYTGVSDGRVLRWRPAEGRWEEHSCSAPELLESCRGSQDPGREHECGRPLGLKFNNETGELRSGLYLMLSGNQDRCVTWFPDNIKWSPRGGFWVGLHAKRGKIAKWSISYPWLRKLILKLPMRHVQRVSTILSQLGRQVIALRLSEEGKMIEAVSVHGDVQKAFKSVSEVEERNGSLFIGSVTSPFLGVYRL